MDSPTTLTNDDDQLKKVNESEDLLDYSQKVYLVKEIGPPPEDPVCDSGIYCYGKKYFVIRCQFHQRSTAFALVDPKSVKRY